MLGDGKDQPKIMASRKEVGEWMESFKVPWEA